jgi:hypothetical protein
METFTTITFVATVLVALGLIVFGRKDNPARQLILTVCVALAAVAIFVLLLAKL